MTLATELDKPNICQIYAVKVEFPGLTVRFFTGRGQITLFSETYLGAGIPGEDGTFGTLEAIEGAVGEDAPRLRLTLGGLSPSIAAEAKNYLSQGSPVYVYDVVLDPATLAPVATPEPAFLGFVDVPGIEVGDQMAISLDCASVWEYFFRDDEALRRSDRMHQIIWPGEKWYEFASQTTRKLPWGL